MSTGAGTPLRILLVDDEQGYVSVLTKRLSLRGMNVTGALSGTEALQLMRGQDFDVAVLDLKMDDMDGIEVLRVLRRMAPEMPVLMLTGHGSQLAAREGMAGGAFDYLTKPCELEQLIEKIQEAVESAGK